MAILTGSMRTSELPRMGEGPVTVTVSRTVEPGRSAEFQAVIDRFEESLAAFPGCLGVGVLRPGSEIGPHQIVFRFTDPMSLRRWERSAERAAILAELEPLVIDTRVQRVAGVEQFFAAPDHLPPARPRWHSILSDVGWVFPVALTSTLVISPHLNMIPMVPRVALGVLIITSVMAFAVDPFRKAARRRRRMRMGL
jgi:antibiotic biosynthesis monooxygenase (ABM) superfamily enzyme